MNSENFHSLPGGVLKRKTKRKVAIFIDAANLDRACRRINRKVALAKLVSSLLSGSSPALVRYYCLIPFEDDSRQSSFLNSLEKYGIEVITKRLPPKGVKRHVSMDVPITCDIMELCAGYSKQTDEDISGKITLILVCPNLELSYVINKVQQESAKVSIADFEPAGKSDGWKGIRDWVDLSSSETIWL